jgi:hypothetical protein
MHALPPSTGTLPQRSKQLQPPVDSCRHGDALQTAVSKCRHRAMERAARLFPGRLSVAETGFTDYFEKGFDIPRYSGNSSMEVFRWEQ